MRELPSVQDLADASPKRIHKLWEGLGYYTRVRNMQRAAQLIVECHDGCFPETFEQVRELPGIGRYTAGAICSIAFNQPKPVLDGNVIRVLARAFGIRGNPRQRAVNERLWDLAEHLVLAASTENLDRGARHNCGDLNQSMMELGATLCTPRDPQCGICPIALHCVAHRTHCAHLLPRFPPRPRATARLFFAFVVEHKGRFLVRQRAAGSVNAYLWEFPNIEIEEADSLSKALGKTLGTDGTDGTEVEHWFDIRHSITRYRITLRVFRLKAISKAMNGRWVGARGLSRLAFPSAHKKILGRLPEGGESLCWLAARN